MKKLKLEDLSDKLLNCEYAVRGAITIKANALFNRLKSGEKLGFDKITYCNIGNPQRLNQKPLTFVRNVLALVSSPYLLGQKEEFLLKIFKKDELARARFIVKNCPGVLGGYTHSQGLDFIRKEIATFIQDRDGKDTPLPKIDRIFMSDGASVAIQNVMSALFKKDTDAIMIPVPQYPLYSASIVLYGGKQGSYYLDEENDWATSKKELVRSLKEAKEKGMTPRALVAINPGNPTGQVLDVKTMKIIINFCLENSLVLLADEVYQENVYNPKKKWSSFRQVMYSMGKKVYETLHLVSFHSTSKGFFGECGRRGGFAEFANSWDQKLIDAWYKRASLNLNPNIDGQITMSCLVNPPKKGDVSYELYEKERKAILGSLKRRGEKLCKALNGLENMSCNMTSGAMYAFPNIIMPKKAVEAAKKAGYEAPDAFYCIKFLEATGVCVVPGSGFGQKKGTHHFRTTFLPQEEIFDEVVEKFKKFHTAFMKQYK